MRFAPRWILLFAAVGLFSGNCPAQGAQPFHFLVVPYEDEHNARDESFVVQLSAEQRAAVQALKAQGKFAQFSGRVASGAADYNRNYVQPARPGWNWHVAAVEEIVPAGSISPAAPQGDAHPSDIAADPARWIAENGDRYAPRRYRIGAEFDPASAEKFYYWLGPRMFASNDSFVVEVDHVTHGRIQELFWMRHEVGVRGEIAAGSVAYNKNYSRPGRPVWNWHFKTVTGLRDFTIFNIDTMELNPNRDSAPSEIAANPEQWIQTHGPSYRPKDFKIYRQVMPGTAAVANVSNRGMTGSGEKALITGLIITGGEPRNVVVRALGPSMAAAGVQQPAMNPKIEVFSGATRVAANSDWKAGARASVLAESYPALAPTDDREAAMLLTLMPGTYTLHGTNEDGSEGVMLLEAYDVDSSGNP